MNDKPPSTNGSGKTGLFKRVLRAIKDDPLSRDEIHDLLQEDESVFGPEEKEMLSGVLDVAETQVREVMVPRSQMVVIEKDQALSEMLDVIICSGHSRFPVIGEDRDEVLGVLLAKDLLKFFGDSSEPELQIEKFLRPASVIPESKRLNALLK
jgi:magnesium and cobalt transporter